MYKILEEIYMKYIEIRDRENSTIEEKLSELRLLESRLKHLENKDATPLLKAIQKMILNDITEAIVLLIMNRNTYVLSQGKQVMCISNNGLETCLTKGKEYTVEKESESHYWIKDDEGDICEYYKQRFKTVWRNHNE